MVKKHNLSPLTEATYYILICLSNPLHGYGIIKKIEEMSNQRITLAAGTLYGAISSLQKNGLIIPVDSESEKASKRRKLYKRTDSGDELVQYEIRRLEEMVKNGLAECTIGGE